MSRRYKKLQKFQRTGKCNRCSTKRIVAARIPECECRSDKEKHGEVFDPRRRARDRTKLRRHDGEHDGSRQQDPGDQAYDFSGGHRSGSRIARLYEPGMLAGGQTASTPPISLPVRVPDQSRTLLKFLGFFDLCNVRSLRRLSYPRPCRSNAVCPCYLTPLTSVHFARSSITCILIRARWLLPGRTMKRWRCKPVVLCRSI